MAAHRLFSLGGVGVSRVRHVTGASPDVSTLFEAGLPLTGPVHLKGLRLAAMIRSHALLHSVRGGPRQ